MTPGGSGAAAATAHRGAAEVLPPAYLDEGLRQRWAELAPAAYPGTLSRATADAFARYVVAEQEYLRAARHALQALHVGDADEAAKWSAVQERFAREIAWLGGRFGLTPGAELL